MTRKPFMVLAAVALSIVASVGLTGCDEHCYPVHLNQPGARAPWEYRPYSGGRGGSWWAWTKTGYSYRGASLSQYSVIYNTYSCAVEWSNSNPG